MNVTKILRKALCLLLALSVILGMGAGAFAVEAKAATSVAERSGTDAPLGDYGSTKTIYTGDDYYDDQFSIRLDAYQNSTSSTTSTAVPLDVTIVLDRSQSMSQPASTDSKEYKSFKSYYPGAILYQDSTYGWWTFDHEDIVESTNIKNTITQINAYLDTLDKTKYEGYYRATNYLKRGVPYFQNNHVGFAACGFASWEPLRYNNSTKQWEMRVTNGLWGGDFPGGINTMDFTTGSIQNKQVEWMSVAEAYKEYCARNRRNIYTGKQVKPGTVDTTGYTGYYDFVIATPRLTKAIDATETFIRNIYNSSKSLPSGETHKVSILSFGTGAFYVGGKYAYNQYDAATDKAVKIESTLKEELNVSKAITNLNSDANLNSVLKILRSHYTYTNTRTDWALEAVEKETQFLPNKVDGRKQVVILITDGAPTYSDNMELNVANSALAAAKKLKSAGVEVYTIGFMAGLNDATAPGTFNSSDPGNPTNANSFLAACSSKYPAASAMGTYGAADTSGTPYYLADDGSGSKLAAIFKTMEEHIFETSYAGHFQDVKHLSIYDEITGEFNIDAGRTLSVYAYPYTGNNVFGPMEKLADHSFTAPTAGTPSKVTGNGYTIHLTEDNGIVKVQLNWSDAKYAYLRNEDVKAGGLYDARFPKGYKIMLEVPIVVDRGVTLGGNNIPTNKNVSGFYKPDATGSDTGRGDDLVVYPVPNVNVKFSISAEVYDYFMDLKDYAEKFQNPDLNGKDAQAVFEAMYQTIDTLKELLTGEKNDYLHIDVELFNSLGQFLDGWRADAGADDFTARAPQNGATFDFMVDQVLNFLITMTPKTNEYDSCVDANNGQGVEPYDPVKVELHPNYYGPKYVVVDFDETVKTPLNKEGGLNPVLQSGVTNGKIEGTDICYNFCANYASGNKEYLEKNYTTVGYQVTAINAPKAQNGNKTVARNFYVIPANVMTYDDTFLSYDNNGWETVGTYSDSEQSHDNSVIHGFDSLYNGTYSKDYYHNALKAVTVSNAKGKAQATFTFTGTGFDIFAQTSPNSGTMTVELCTDSSFNTDTKVVLVDTYLNDATLNQIPVVRMDGLAYRTWYVRITAFYDRIFDHNLNKSVRGGEPTEAKLREMLNIPADADFTFVPSASGYDHPATRLANAKNGQYNIYIDGIRVYNTLGTSLANNAVANYAYKQAGESVANIVNVNDALVDAANANAWANLDLENETADGILYMAAGGGTSNQTDVTPGIILGMNGALYTKNSNGMFYVYKDAALTVNVKYNGNNVYYRVQEITSPNGRTYQGLNYFYDGGSKTVPMTTKQIEAAFGGMPTYYNAKYSQYGPEKEVYLSGYNGVAFKVGKGATKVMMSLKSHNGNSAYVQFYDHSLKKFQTLTVTTSRVEMYYDITKYVSEDGYVYIRNANPKIDDAGTRANGIAAICNIKYIGAVTKAITVDAELIKNAVEIFANAELPLDESVEIKHSLNLESDLSLNYAVETEKLADYDKSYLEVTFNGNTYALEAEIRGNYGYFTLDGITAVDMTEEIRATLHLFMGEEEFVSETDVYTVADYAYAQLNKEEASAELKAICANLLRYGAQAQTYKAHNLDKLADAQMTEEHKTYVTDLDAVVLENKAQAMGDVENAMAWAGKALVLDSKVAVKAVFDLSTFAGDMAALNLRVSYTDCRGNVCTLAISEYETYNAEKALYSFTIDSLKAADMRSLLTMALYEGETQISETQVYSAESYCAGKTEALGDLCKALMAYSDAAKAYFAK